MPAPLAVGVLLLLVLQAGCAWRRLGRQPARSIVVPWGRAPARVDGLPVGDLRVEWRGPLAWVSWRRGPRRDRLMFWPDTLPPPRRRELRLAARSRVISSSRPAMAP